METRSVTELPTQLGLRAKEDAVHACSEGGLGEDQGRNHGDREGLDLGFLSR